MPAKNVAPWALAQRINSVHIEWAPKCFKQVLQAYSLRNYDLESQGSLSGRSNV